MTHILLYNNANEILEFVKEEDALNNLYFGKSKLPTEEDIRKYMKHGGDKEILKYIKEREPEKIIKKIKKKLSSIDYFIPLYDIYTKNLYLINRENVYKRVVYDYYRFPDKRFVKYLEKRKKELEKKIKSDMNNKVEMKNLGEFKKDQTIHYDIEHKKIREKEELSKLELMLEFLSSFDLDILQDTYVKVFYFSSNEVGKNITVCTKPSFLPHFKHINPYYTRAELINLALNMEIIKESNLYYDQEKLMELCDQVKINDISAKTIMKHQKHIIDNNKIGIIQYYSLQGSYFMNEYMRGFAPYDYKNELLEREIRSMWELINTAPEFDKSYTLYRFIHDDSYLKHLKIGEEFVDPSFISTTRDPFYRADTYKFGFILIKIKIPGKTQGVGLCIESYSHFPKEQEIILPPKSILKLEKKDENAVYYHTDAMFKSKVLTRYEFSYQGKEEISFIDRPILQDKGDIVDFLKLEEIKSITVYEKIRFFVDEYVNDIYQFKTKIGDNVYDLIVEWYDSTSAYKEFYASTTNNGFSIYTILNNYIAFFIELGEESNETYMYVNYYFRYASTNPKKEIKDIDFVNFLSKLAYYFGIRNVTLFAEYYSCDLEREMASKNDIEIYRGGNYCVDFYRYFKDKRRRFQNKELRMDSTEIKTQFSYYELDRMKEIDPIKILRKEDRDELYQIYVKTYQTFFSKEKYNLADFYIWMVENQCINLKFLVEKIHRIFNYNNPFENDYYILDAIGYLYNQGIISEYPSFKKSKKHKGITDGDAPKNEYRLDLYRRNKTKSFRRNF